MKALAFVLFLSATALQAAPKMFGFDTSDLKAGEARVFMVDDTARVTLRRDGKVRRITVERLGITNWYTLEPVDGVLQVTRRDVGQGPVISPHGIIVDGVALEGSTLGEPPASPEPRGKALFYICPKDQTMLRVPHSDHAGRFKCPVDGTPMRASSGPRSPYFLLEE